MWSELKWRWKRHVEIKGGSPSKQRGGHCNLPKEATYELNHEGAVGIWFLHLFYAKDRSIKLWFIYSSTPSKLTFSSSHHVHAAESPAHPILLCSQLSKTSPARSQQLSEASLWPWWCISAIWHHLTLLPNTYESPRLSGVSKCPVCNKNSTTRFPQNLWKVPASCSKQRRLGKVIWKILWWNNKIVWNSLLMTAKPKTDSPGENIGTDLNLCPQRGDPEFKVWPWTKLHSAPGLSTNSA